MELAVNGADAIPEALVATVIVAVLLLNVPDAPVDGAVKTTLTPDTGLLELSFTVTPGVIAKAVPTAVDCGVEPVLTVIVPADKGKLVNTKVTVYPAATAVTL